MTMMLATSLWWWLNDGDFRCWWQNHYVGDFFHYVWDFLNEFTNILNRSPTSKSCHQHIWSQTSVINIDVTVIILVKRELRGSLKELKHLQKLNCGFISCYSRSVEIVEESKIFQLCSTYMDTSDDNFDLNDFLGIGINVVHIRGLICNIW